MQMLVNLKIEENSTKQIYLTMTLWRICICYVLESFWLCNFNVKLNQITEKQNILTLVLKKKYIYMCAGNLSCKYLRQILFVLKHIQLNDII